jgi:hypothetical protein
MARIVNAFALTSLLATESEARRRGHDQCIKQLECWLTILLVLGAVALAAGYYSYCVYGKYMDRKLYDPTRGWSPEQRQAGGDRTAHAGSRRDAHDVRNTDS